MAHVTVNLITPTTSFLTCKDPAFVTDVMQKTIDHQNELQTLYKHIILSKHKAT